MSLEVVVGVYTVHSGSHAVQTMEGYTAGDFEVESEVRYGYLHVCVESEEVNLQLGKVLERNIMVCAGAHTAACFHSQEEESKEVRLCLVLKFGSLKTLDDWE